MVDMMDRTLKNMELLSSSKSSLAKFLRIQRSISTLPALVVYSVVGLYFTGLNFFHLNYLLGALALYLLGVAVNGYNNLFDIEEDKLATSSGIVKANYLLRIVSHWKPRICCLMRFFICSWNCVHQAN
jgi:hypothetical protein